MFPIMKFFEYFFHVFPNFVVKYGFITQSLHRLENPNVSKLLFIATVSKMDMGY